MKISSGVAVPMALAVAVLGVSPSCNKRAEVISADLGEAGYKLTVEDWLRAARANDLVALEKFVSAGFKADSRDTSGDSALHAAASSGAEKAANFLLGRGLSIDLRGASDRTPLMAAVLADKPEMVAYLLRQGADPRAKDKEGFMPIMLAARDGKSGAVAELAPYNREDLDSALLLAALVGQANVIDSLTDYGASVYARMEDGRTPLMIAAENGHREAVELLVDLGSSRFAIDGEGRTAAQLATAAGHGDIAAFISRDPLPEEMALETPEEIATEMTTFVDAATGAKHTEAEAPVTPIDGKTIGSSEAAAPTADTSTTAAASPPLVMRHYRQRDMPVEIRTVQGDAAVVKIAGPASREVKIKAGETIPRSRLTVVRVERRMEDSKVNLGVPTEISVVSVRDNVSGSTREWISGIPSTGHDPVALVEDSSTGRRYTASIGQRFKTAGGTEYIVTDVRPNQLVVEETAGGTVQTIRLRGPRG